MQFNYRRVDYKITWIVVILTPKGWNVETKVEFPVPHKNYNIKRLYGMERVGCQSGDCFVTTIFRFWLALRDKIKSEQRNG